MCFRVYNYSEFNYFTSNIGTVGNFQIKYYASEIPIAALQTFTRCTKDVGKFSNLSLINNLLLPKVQSCPLKLLAVITFPFSIGIDQILIIPVHLSIKSGADFQ